MPSLADDLWCFTCGASYGVERERLRCECGMPLEQRYRSEGALLELPANTRQGIWRFESLLPETPIQSRQSLGEGNTPLIHCPRLSEEYSLDIWVKDEGRNPTGSFKARGAAVGVSKLEALGWRRLRIETIGNAGSAWSAYAARAGLQMWVDIPDDSRLPVLGFIEPPLYGGSVHLEHENPTYTARSCDEIFVGAFAEPYRLEGEKTILFEVVEQLGATAPDVIVWPTGGGVGLVGLAKAYQELQSHSGLQATQPMYIVAAQHTGSAPVTQVLRGGAADPSLSFPPSGIAPGVWPGSGMHLAYIRDRVTSATGAFGTTADDQDILDAMRAAAALEGLLLGPEGALAVASLKQLVLDRVVSRGSRAVCVNTSSAMRYPNLLTAHLVTREMTTYPATITED